MDHVPLTDKDYRIWIFLGFIAFSVLTYLPVFSLPYLYMDDNWITRTDDEDPEGYRSLSSTVALIQGRPVFAVLLQGTRFASTQFGGLEVMRYLRLVAIVLLGVFGYLLCRWLEKFGFPRWLAILFSVLVLSLPAAQIQVACGPWLLLPILLAGCAVPLGFSFFEKEKPRFRDYFLGLALPFLLLVIALATYQQSYLVCLGFLLIPIFTFQLTEFSLRRFRTIVLCSVTIFVALVVYYYTWCLAYETWNPWPEEERYNPGATVPWDTFFEERLAFFWSIRLPQATNWWRPMIAPSFDFYLTLSVIGLGLFAHFLTIIRARWGIVLALPELIVKGGVGAVLCVCSDIFILKSGKEITTFTTLFALTLTVCLLVGWSCYAFWRVLPQERWRFNVPLSWKYAAAGLACLFALCSAQKSVTVHFAVPLSTELALMKSDILRHRAQHGDLQQMVVYTRERNFHDRGYSDFTWDNLSHEFYIYWLTRNVLDMLHLPPNVSVFVFQKGRDQPMLSNPRGAPAGQTDSAPSLILDYRHLTTK